MLGNSRSSLASCSRNFYCIILCLLASHTTLVTSESHTIFEFIFISMLCMNFVFHLFLIKWQVQKWVENMKNNMKYKNNIKMCLTCLFDFKSYSFVGNPWVDSRITTHYTIFPFLEHCRPPLLYTLYHHYTTT